MSDPVGTYRSAQAPLRALRIPANPGATITRKGPWTKHFRISQVPAMETGLRARP